MTNSTVENGSTTPTTRKPRLPRVPRMSRVPLELPSPVRRKPEDGEPMRPRPGWEIEAHPAPPEGEPPKHRYDDSGARTPPDEMALAIPSTSRSTTPPLIDQIEVQALGRLMGSEAWGPTPRELSADDRWLLAELRASRDPGSVPTFTAEEVGKAAALLAARWRSNIVLRLRTLCWILMACIAFSLVALGFLIAAHDAAVPTEVDAGSGVVCSRASGDSVKIGSAVATVPLRSIADLEPERLRQIDAAVLRDRRRPGEHLLRVQWLVKEHSGSVTLHFSQNRSMTIGPGGARMRWGSGKEEPLRSDYESAELSSHAIFNLQAVVQTEKAEI